MHTIKVLASELSLPDWWTCSKVVERIQYSSVATRIDACDKSVSIENVGDGKGNAPGINATRNKDAVWKRAKIVELADESVLGARPNKVGEIAAQIKGDDKVVADSMAVLIDLS